MISKTNWQNYVEKFIEQTDNYLKINQVEIQSTFFSDHFLKQIKPFNENDRNKLRGFK